MKNIRNTIAAAVLSLPLFVVSGCAADRIVYSSDFVVQTESVTEHVTTNQQENEVSEAVPMQISETEMSVYGYVYLCGAVAKPGVYPIMADTRLYEVVEHAGGFLPEADSEWLNLAVPLEDGQRVYVYTTEETAQLKENGTVFPEESLSPGSSEAANGKININTADEQTLMSLPGIGEAKAKAIIAYRQQNGSFHSIEDLQQISGIKNAVFSKIKDLITV